MENESEMIRQQMDETRTALTDKIEMLEHQLVETVQAASTSVAETVGSVKEIAHDSLQTVKESVHETLETVKDAFDLQRQVNQRPWTMFAGATALGYLGGCLLRGSNGRERRTSGISENRAPAINVHTAQSRNGAAEGRDATLSAAEQPSWLSQQGNTFHSEISQLKALAVGTLLGIVRDIVTKNVPEHMERQVEKIVNGVTVKLGGQPIDGHILLERSRIKGFGKNGNQGDCGYQVQSS